MPEPRSDELQVEALRKLFAEAPVTGFLGLGLTGCGDGAAEVSLPFRPELVQGKGVVHGGIVTLMADTAGWFAAASEGHSHLATAQLSVNLLAPVRSENLVATGRVLNSGRRLVVCDLRVETDAGTLVAAGQATYVILS